MYESTDYFRRLVHFVCAVLAGRAARFDSFSSCLALVLAVATYRCHDECGICVDSDLTVFASPSARIAKVWVPHLSDTA